MRAIKAAHDWGVSVGAEGVVLCRYSLVAPGRENDVRVDVHFGPRSCGVGRAGCGVRRGCRTASGTGRRIIGGIEPGRTTWQIEARHMRGGRGDDFSPPHHGQAWGAQPNRLDRIGGLQNHHIGVGADL